MKSERVVVSIGVFIIATCFFAFLHQRNSGHGGPSIRFFGKVIDENGQPVPGVVIRFLADGDRGNFLPYAATDHYESSGEATTDSQGLFSVVDVEGEFLTVEPKSEKVRFGKSSGGATFRYGPNSRGRDTPHLGDPKYPVALHLFAD